jgi:hypothetical protein
MTRSIKSANRPSAHLFDPDPDVPADWLGHRFCHAVVPAAHGEGQLRCALPEDDSVHVTAEDLVADLPPNPPEAQEIDDRILGEG